MASPNTQVGCFSGLTNWISRRTPVSTVSVYGRHRPNDMKLLSDCVPDDGLYTGGKGHYVEKETLPPYSIRSKVDVPSSSLEITKTIEKSLDDLSPELRKLSLKIHGRPELAFEEKYAHDVLTDFMEKHGFKVTRHYDGLETAWRAEYTVGHGGRVLGVNSEMDALPGVGHACGHNLIAVSGAGVAIAIKAALITYNVPGKIVLLGTPAEERGGGKIILLRRGAYNDMDVCVMSHPMAGPSNSVSNGTTSAMSSLVIEYLGKTAHAAAAPWEGKNALDAAVLAYSSVSALRQQLKPEIRIHGIIEGRDWVPNVIPDYAKLTYLVRAPNPADVAETVVRVKGCFVGAASATGCKVSFQALSPYYDLRQNPVLASEFSKNVASRYGMMTQTLDSGASTDFGNVTYALPAIHPTYAIPTEPNGANHTAGFTRSAATQDAHDITIKVSKGLALTGFRVLYDSAFFEEVKEAFIADKRIGGNA